jgi:hypothetical protein
MGSLEFFYQHTLHENWQNVVSPIHSAKDLSGVTQSFAKSRPMELKNEDASSQKKKLKINSKSNIFHGKSRRYEAGGFEPSMYVP